MDRRARDPGHFGPSVRTGGGAGAPRALRPPAPRGRGANRPRPSGAPRPRAVRAMVPGRPGSDRPRCLGMDGHRDDGSSGPRYRGAADHEGGNADVPMALSTSGRGRRYVRASGPRRLGSWGRRDGSPSGPRRRDAGGHEGGRPDIPMNRGTSDPQGGWASGPKRRMTFGLRIVRISGPGISWALDLGRRGVEVRRCRWTEAPTVRGAGDHRAPGRRGQWLLGARDRASQGATGPRGG
jgi:hypothetical protein